MPTDVARDPRPALEPSSMSEGGRRLDTAVVALSRPVDFFLTTTRDIRRWIFASRILFCCTTRSQTS